MSKLILVRHGESSGNRDRIFAISPHDLPLTELGYAQASEAGQLIAARFQPELVVSSDMRRASETARVIAGALGLPLQFEPDLHEREIGAHRGRSYDSLAKNLTMIRSARGRGNLKAARATRMFRRASDPFSTDWPPTIPPRTSSWSATAE